MNKAGTYTTNSEGELVYWETNTKTITYKNDGSVVVKYNQY